MQHFSLEQRPSIPSQPYRKKTLTQLTFLTEPFTLDTQEGVLEYSPESTDDWQGGYFVAYPADGSKPYGISRKFVEDNYVLAE